MEEASGDAVPTPRRLFVLSQNNLALFCEVTPEAPIEAREFRAYGTGHILPDDPGHYLGTVMLFKGELVFHIYE